MSQTRWITKKQFINFVERCIYGSSTPYDLWDDFGVIEDSAIDEDFLDGFCDRYDKNQNGDKFWDIDIEQCEDGRSWIRIHSEDSDGNYPVGIRSATLCRDKTLFDGNCLGFFRSQNDLKTVVHLVKQGHDTTCK